MHRRLIGLLAILLLAGCRPSETGGTDAGPRDPGGAEIKVFASNLPFEQVRKKLRSSDEPAVVNAIVQMATMKDRSEVAHLLNAAWSGSRSEYPDLNWDLLGKTPARVALAQVLGGWNRADPQFRSFILRELDSANGIDQVAVLIAFGAVAVEADIPLLERLSRGSDELAAAAAMSALQVADTDPSRLALVQIANEPTTPDSRKKLARQLLAMPRASEHLGLIH